MNVMTEPSLADVQMVVEEVWTSFLGAEEPLLTAVEAHDHHGWMAAVTVTGAWEGVITVELPFSMAEEVTRRMLGVDEAAEEDVADAVGELVNMIGGNVKSLMPGPSTLSLPVVAAGRVAWPSDAAEVCRFDAVWASDPLAVCVHVLHPEA